jgi:DUF1680 family protein
MFCLILFLVSSVRPDTISSIDDYVTWTAAGRAPILPTRVVCNGVQFDDPTPSVKGNNNFDFGETFNSSLLAVTWAAVDPSLFGTDKANSQFTVEGVVQYEGKNYTAKAVISVKNRVAAPNYNRAVTFENIRINDIFWEPKQKVNAINTINAGVYRIGLNTGGELNFDNSIKKLKKEKHDGFKGLLFQDSDFYKVFEGIAHTLLVISEDSSMDDQKVKLEAVAKKWLQKVEQVQYSDGYIDTFFTLRAKGMTHRFRFFDHHEMYMQGHMIEAAIAYTRYKEAVNKPDYRFYEVAKRTADNIVRLFGPNGKRNEVPGHEEIELALVKFSKLVEEFEGEGTGEKYIDTAKLLIDRRGENRSLRESNHYGGTHSQDNVPFIKQTNVVGHSVRAGYFFSGITDIVALLPESNPDRAAYLKTLDMICDRVVHNNTYITGGVGIAGNLEGFGHDYQLPNDHSYCETCASIAMALWFQRMNLVHKDTKYVDSMERVLYNGVLVGTNLNGDLFFYNSLLEVSKGDHRSPWFLCACCPTNYMRTISSLGGYLYTIHGIDVYVNLFIGSTGKLNVNGTNVGVKQDTRYPWDGDVRIIVTPDVKKEFTMNIRIPGWIQSQKNNTVTMKVNGNAVSTTDLVKGYVVINRTWSAGDVIEINFPLEVRITQPDPNVKTNAGKVAIERGPIVYCMETAGNGELNNKGTSFNPLEFIIPSNAIFTATYNANLLRGVVELRADVFHQNNTNRVKLQAIPYYAWNNRGDDGKEGQNNGSRMLIWTKGFNVTTSPSTHFVKLDDFVPEDNK